MAIQNRRGFEADFDASKMLPGEFAVSLDERKVRVAFAPGDVEELTFQKYMPEAITATAEEARQALEDADGAAARAEDAVEQIEEVREEVADLAEWLRERNLLKGSLELDNSLWENNCYSHAQGGDDPQGGNNAHRFYAATGDGRYNYIASRKTVNDPLTQNYQMYAFSVWLRADADKQISLAIDQNPQMLNVTTSWKRFVIAQYIETPEGGEGGNNQQAVIGGFGTFMSGWLEVYYPTVTFLDQAKVAYTGSGFDLIDYDALAEAILDKLTSKTFSGVAGGTRTLIDAINLLQSGAGLYNNALYTATGSNSGSGSAITDGSYARIGRTGSAGAYALSVTTKDTNGDVSYYTITTAAGDFLPLYYKILSVTTLKVTYSGSSVADKGEMSLTGTYTRNAKATNVYLIPRQADRGYFYGCSDAQQGSTTTWTVTAKIRNVTGSAQTTATGYVFVVQCQK